VKYTYVPIYHYCVYPQEHSNSDSDSVIIDDSSEDEAPPQLLGQEASLSDIDRLRIEKERLTRKLQSQQQTQQDIEVLSSHPHNMGGNVIFPTIWSFFFIKSSTQ